MSANVKVPVLSREDALAVTEYADARGAQLEATAADMRKSRNRRDASLVEAKATGIREFALALANAARKGE